jgi:O-antigen/teichoic acid export membrane protein
MLKRLLKDSSIYGISGVLSKGISIFLVPFYTRVLAPKDYGTLDIISIVGVIATVLLGMEIYQAIARYYFECNTDIDKEQYVSTAFFFCTISFSVLAVVTQIFAAPFSALLLGNDSHAVIVRIAGINIFFMGLYHFSLDILRYRLEPKKHALCSITYSLVTITTSIFLVLILRHGIIGVFYAQTVSNALSFLFALSLGRTSYVFLFSPSILRIMLRFSLPLVPSSLAVYVLNYIDRISIRSLLGLSELGIYGIGFRVSSIVPVAMLAINMAFTPLIYSTYKDKETPRHIAEFMRYFVFAALIVISCVSLFSKEILIVLTTPNYYAAYSVVPFLVTSAFVSNMYNFAPGLPIAKKTRHIAVIQVVSAGVSIVLNLSLIPVFGIVGAACANLASAAFAFSANLFFSQKNYHVPYNHGVLLGSVTITAGIIIAGYLLHTQSMIINIALKSLLLFLLPVILFVVGLIDRHVFFTRILNLRKS